jgi:hypothetical protein
MHTVRSMSSTLGTLGRHEIEIGESRLASRSKRSPTFNCRGWDVSIYCGRFVAVVTQTAAVVAHMGAWTTLAAKTLRPVIETEIRQASDIGEQNGLTGARSSVPQSGLFNALDHVVCLATKC